jgi:RNA polymerase sigma-70 factor (ECF subfamily)
MAAFEAANRPVAAAIPARSDPASFESLMREHNQRLYRLAFSLLGEASEAEDVLQESYVRAYQRLATFAGRSSLGAWLAGIVRHAALDHLRARRARDRRFTLESDLPARDDDARSMLERAPTESPHHSPETSVGCDEMRAVLEGAIAALPAAFRSVFMLREVEGLSLLETAAYLDIPVATVKTRDHRARALLREALSSADGAIDGTFPFLGERCDRIVSRVLNRIARL